MTEKVMQNSLFTGRRFWKMSGTGNDFIIINNRDEKFSASHQAAFESICHRRSGVGADGLVLVEKGIGVPARMRYFNSDGQEAEMCGNAARCTAWYARNFGFTDQNEFILQTKDSRHSVEVAGDTVHLTMITPTDYKEKTPHKAPGLKEGGYINTGVPHLVYISDNVDEVDVSLLGRQLRQASNANVNFVQIVSDGKLYVRTYERGVEAETLSCGTGCVAAALLVGKIGNLKSPINIETRGGKLAVTYDYDWQKIVLSGKVDLVFEGIFK